MTAAKRCDYPTVLTQDPDEVEFCGEPAVWETDDLRECHNLCDRHCNAALQWNDFRREEL